MLNKYDHLLQDDKVEYRSHVRKVWAGLNVTIGEDFDEDMVCVVCSGSPLFWIRLVLIPTKTGMLKLRNYILTVVITMVNNRSHPCLPPFLLFDI